LLSLARAQAASAVKRIRKAEPALTVKWRFLQPAERTS
jgi:hypothetical protein